MGEKEIISSRDQSTPHLGEKDYLTQHTAVPVPE